MLNHQISLLKYVCSPGPEWCDLPHLCLDKRSVGRYSSLSEMHVLVLDQSGAVIGGDDQSRSLNLCTCFLFSVGDETAALPCFDSF